MPVRADADGEATDEIYPKVDLMPCVPLLSHSGNPVVNEGPLSGGVRAGAYFRNGWKADIR